MTLERVVNIANNRLKPGSASRYCLLFFLIVKGGGLLPAIREKILPMSVLKYGLINKYNNLSIFPYWYFYEGFVCMDFRAETMQRSIMCK